MVQKENFASTLDWYASNFNLAVTDAVFDPETRADETVFMHIDKGLEYTDHLVS